MNKQEKTKRAIEALAGVSCFKCTHLDKCTSETFNWFGKNKQLFVCAEYQEPEIINIQYCSGNVMIGAHYDTNVKLRINPTQVAGRAKRTNEEKE